MKSIRYITFFLLLTVACTESVSAQFKKIKQQMLEYALAEARAIQSRTEEIINEFPNYSTYSFSENELEWNEFKMKKASGLVMGDCFLLENKGVMPSVYTITELPINTAGEFIETVVIDVNKFDKGTYYTFYVNVEDIQNCTAVVFSTQTVRTFHIKDGRPSGEQQAILNSKKGVTQIFISVKKVDGNVTLSINGDECIKFKKIDFTNAGIGFAALPKQRIKIIAVGAGSKNPDEE